MLEWEGGKITTEPLEVVGNDDPITCAICAKENDFLNLSRWKQFKSIAHRQKKFERMIKQAHIRSFRTAPKHKHEVPKDCEGAKRLDGVLCCALCGSL